MNQNWIENAPPIRPEEEGLNPSHLQRLRYNPNYYYPNEEDLKIIQKKSRRNTIF